MKWHRLIVRVALDDDWRPPADMQLQVGQAVGAMVIDSAFLIVEDENGPESAATPEVAPRSGEGLAGRERQHHAPPRGASGANATRGIREGS